jgi:hypothetical protein
VWQTLTFDATVAEGQRIHAIRIYLMGAAADESGFGSAPFNGTVYFDRLTLSIGKNAIQYFNNGALSSATRLPSDLNYISVGADAVDVTGITAPSTFTGLYLGNNKMGYVAGNPSLAASWKTYMDQQGNFYLKGSGTNKLEWNGSDLTINGTVNATSGSFSGDISGASGTF